MGFFFFLLRLHSFFPSLHIGTKENGGGEGRYSHAMGGNCLYVCILREGKIFSGVCNSPGYPSSDPCYSDHSDTDRYGIPPPPPFLDCPLGWDLPLDYILSMKGKKTVSYWKAQRRRKRRILLHSEFVSVFRHSWYGI